MNRRVVTVATVGAAALAFLGGLGSGRATVISTLVPGCPADASSFADPWLLVSAGDGSVRLADRDGDGSVCIARVVVRSRVPLTLVADNSIGDAGIIPPGPCTDPFTPVAIGTPTILPAVREIDVNADGVVCGSASLVTGGLIIVLLDNPNAALR